MKIVIVGGGTAGWLSAYFIENSQPGVHDITVIESSKVGIIGAGEGSTGMFLEVLNGGFFEKKVDIEEFINETDATNKMGIRHYNWSRLGGSYFAPLDISPTGFTLNDYIFKYCYLKYGSSGMHVASKIGRMYQEKKYNRYSALHFDGHKVGKFFKNKLNRVKTLDTVIKDVFINHNGEIECLVSDNNVKIYADFFIDCSGFSKILSSSLGMKWISSSDYLPLNTAIPFSLPAPKKYLPETSAIAIENGWIWKIPLKTRTGCGYVFDKNFITVDKAIDEAQKTIGYKVDPIKIIEFDSGYLNSFWEKNLLCIGLSSSFFEPLEATSIHNTIVQLAIFVNEFLKKEKDQTILDINQIIYNRRITFLMELTRDFLSLHYSGGKTNSHFWKFVLNDLKQSDLVKEILFLTKSGVPGFSIFEGMFGSFSIPLVNWNLAGMNIIKRELCFKDLNEHSYMSIARNEVAILKESVY